MCITGNGLKTLEVMAGQYAGTPAIGAKLGEFDQLVAQIAEATPKAAAVAK